MLMHPNERSMLEGCGYIGQMDDYDPNRAQNGRPANNKEKIAFLKRCNDSPLWMFLIAHLAVEDGPEFGVVRWSKSHPWEIRITTKVFARDWTERKGGEEATYNRLSRQMQSSFCTTFVGSHALMQKQKPLGVYRFFGGHDLLCIPSVPPHALMSLERISRKARESGLFNRRRQPYPVQKIQKPASGTPKQRESGRIRPSNHSPVCRTSASSDITPIDAFPPGMWHPAFAYPPYYPMYPSFDQYGASFAFPQAPPIMYPGATMVAPAPHFLSSEGPHTSFNNSQSADCPSLSADSSPASCALADAPDLSPLIDCHNLSPLLDCHTLSPLSDCPNLPHLSDSHNLSPSHCSQTPYSPEQWSPFTAVSTSSFDHGSPSSFDLGSPQPLLPTVPFPDFLQYGNNVECRPCSYESISSAEDYRVPRRPSCDYESDAVSDTVHLGDEVSDGDVTEFFSVLSSPGFTEKFDSGSIVQSPGEDCEVLEYGCA